ncbi:MAG: DUF4340 domain-containing protein [Candidatus Omnitrophica bacterium]|nr:DUF4340 domain-containing protein [Candidatus Omnitrophota bacterium]
MKPSVTIVFTLLFFVVLGAYLYLGAPRPAKHAKEITPVSNIPEEAIKKSSSMQLLPIAEDDEITAIQIQNLEKKENVTLKRENEGWKISYPVEYPADSLIVDGLIAALTISNKARRLVPEQDWEEYGLEKPELKIGIETKKLDKRLYLYLGDTTPVGDFVFARWEGENEYFLLSANFKKAFQKSIYSLRMKRVFRLPFAKMAKMHVRTTTGDFEIAHHDDKWFWMEPIPILGERVPKEKVDDLFARVQDLHIKDFLDQEPHSKHELGFSLLGTAITLWVDDQHSEMLYLGNEVPTRDSFYAMREGEDVYFLVARPNIRALFELIEALAQETMQKTKPMAVSS